MDIEKFFISGGRFRYDTFLFSDERSDRLYRDEVRITSNGLRRHCFFKALSPRHHLAFCSLMRLRSARFLPAVFIAIALSGAACTHSGEPAINTPEYAHREALLMSPRNELGYLRLASLYQKEQNYAAAKETLRAGLRNVPQSEQIASSLGRLYHTAGQTEQALAFYNDERLEQMDSALLYLDRAQLRAQSQDATGAFADLEEALQREPDLAEAHFWRGVLYMNEQQPEKALGAFIKAAQINPDQASIWRQIAVLWKQAGENQKALNALKTALQLEPHDYPMLQMYASLLEEEIERGQDAQLRELRQSMRVMLEQFPEDPWTLAHAGTVLWQGGEEQAGRELLEEALERRDNYRWAQLRLGLLHLSAQRWNQAIPLLRSGLQDNPENPWALRQLAAAYEQRGEGAAAIRLYEVWIEHPDKQTLALHQVLAALYLNNLRFDEYEALMQRAVQRFPNESYLMQSLAAYYERTRRFHDARELYQQLWQADPTNEERLLQLVQLERRLGETQPAEQRLEQRLAEGEASPVVHQQWIELRRQRLGEAAVVPDLRQMLQAHPDSIWAAVQLAQIYLGDEESAQAEMVLESSLQRHPTAEPLLLLRGRLHERKGEWQAALDLFRLLDQRKHGAALLNHQALAYRKLNQPHLAEKLLERALLQHDWNLWSWYQYLLLRPQNEQQQWFGPQHAQTRHILDAVVSLQFETARQHLRQSSLEEPAASVLKNLLRQLQMESPPNFGDVALPTALEAPLWLRFHLALEAEARQEFVRAEVLYRSVLTEDPHHVWTHARLGSVYADMSQLQKSQQHHARFLQEFPQAVWGTFRLAVLKTMQQEEPEAIRLYQQVLALQPDHAPSLNNLAWTYLTAVDPELRNIQEALSMAQRAVQLQASVDHLDTLAEAYFQSGQPQQALQTIRQAILITPQSSERYPYLLEQFERFRQGNPQTAPPGLSTPS
jgi:tetratricopeptide (TPR) repeat protein